MHSFWGAQTEGAGDGRAEARSPESTNVVGDLAVPGKAASRPITLLIVCAVVLIAAIAAGTSVLIFHFRARALTDGERELSNTALILAEQTERSLQSLELVQTSVIERMQTFGIASPEEFDRRMSGQDIHMMLKDKVSGFPQVESVALFNADGKLINFSRAWPIPALSLADRDHYKALKSDARMTSIVSAPIQNRSAGTWTVYFARKFIGPNGEFLGLVNSRLELRYFERFFSSIALGPDGAISLFHRDGTLLARHPQRDPLGTSYAQGGLFKDVLSHADRGVARLTSIIDGQERLVAGHSLARYPVVVAVGTTVAAALAHWHEEARFLIGAGTLVAVVIIVFAFLVARRLLQRNQQFTQTLGEQKLRLDAALNNMRQGLLLFDSESRLVLYNQRYLKMYGLSPETMKLGCTLRDLLCQRKAVGTFKGDPDKYAAKFVDRSGRFRGDPDVAR